MDWGEVSRTNSLCGMNDEPVPSIFLSHSGQQKEFVTDLFNELLHKRYHSFFDEDPLRSLPPACNYARRIFRACHGCKMAMVVLSNDYFESLWPMLELQEFALHNRDCMIYPIFCEMEPSDLSNKKNLARWRQVWRRKESHWQERVWELQDLMGRSRELTINLEMDKWEKIVKELQYRSGAVRKKVVSNRGQVLYQSRYKYIKEIVANACSVLPISQNAYFVGGEIIGMERMCKEIAQLLEKQAHEHLTIGAAMGMHGIGGSGKSTLCKCLANFFRDEFCGKSYWLELPSSAEESKHIVTKIKGILSSLSSHTLAHGEVSTLEEAMAALEDGLQRNKAFLALDNVWDIDVGGVKDVKKIVLSMTRMRGSKVLVTSRSREMLKRVLHATIAAQNRKSDDFIVHVPSMTDADVVEALSAYSGLQPPQHKLNKLARCCFIGEQYYPLIVKTKGTELRELGRESFTDVEWDNLINSMSLNASLNKGINEEIRFEGEQEANEEDQFVLPVLHKSFDRLSLQLQDFFSDLVTCTFRYDNNAVNMDVVANCEWLAMLYGGKVTADKLRRQILKLEYHGLLDIVKHEFFANEIIRTHDMKANLFENESIRIHDLYKRLARTRDQEAQPDALCKHVFQGKLSRSTTTCEQVAKYKYVHVWFDKDDDDMTWKELLDCHWIARNHQVLWIYMQHINSNLDMRPALAPANYNCWLGGQHLRALRILRLEMIDHLEQIGGWEGVPNLVSLHLIKLRSLRGHVGSMGCLKELETLQVSGCVRLQVRALVVVDELYDLGPPVARDVRPREGCTKAGHDQLPQTAAVAPILMLGLVNGGDVLPRLRNLAFVDNGKELVEVGPLSDAFPALETLDLSCCAGLRSFPGGSCYKIGSSLLTLRLCGCEELRSMELQGSSNNNSNCSELHKYDEDLTDLQELDVSYCERLESIPDLSALRTLRVVRAEGCGALLQEVKLYNNIMINKRRIQYKAAADNMNNVAAATSGRGGGNILGGDSSSLQEIEFWGCEGSSMRVQLGGQTSTTTTTAAVCMRLLEFGAGVRPFSQLTHLSLGLPPASTDHFSGTLDLIAVPHLETLRLARFNKVTKLCLKHNLNLAKLQLQNFPTLEAVTGLGAHHSRLSAIFITDAGRLVAISGAILLPALEEAHINRREAVIKSQCMEAASMDHHELIVEACLHPYFSSWFAPLFSIQREMKQEFGGLSELIDLLY